MKYIFRFIKLPIFIYYNICMIIADSKYYDYLDYFHLNLCHHHNNP